MRIHKTVVEGHTKNTNSKKDNERAPYKFNFDDNYSNSIQL